MKNRSYDTDVLVIGAGHAGIEAAHAAARMGSKTTIVTLSKNKIGYMPCNPAIGGIGKGHIVFEISALGGLMPQLCSRTYLQARMLNTKKGPAVRGLRLQIDKEEYSKAAHQALSCMENLNIIEGMVDELLIDTNRTLCGVRLSNGQTITTHNVIITTGTFLNGLVHIGLYNYGSGREDEAPVTKLAKSIQSLKLSMGRLKTGTPPRLDQNSVAFDRMEKQEADNLDYLFEFYPHITTTKRDCFITHTNPKTHAIIQKHADESPILRGDLHGVGPRYCPSIEDKIKRFPHKTSHQIFVEPESLYSTLIYPNGLSTSLPLHAQEKFIRTIAGFENAHIIRPGYAIEYDFVLPHQLKSTLEVQSVQGLFLAGQINGTTGYEEAAGQGIIAGINAHLRATGKHPFIINRDEGYIGVMIDDLTTLGIDEPYRMFTSRAERRLILRQDNAFTRLTDRAYQLGLIGENFYKDFQNEKTLINESIKQLRAGHNNVDLLRLFNSNDQIKNTVHKYSQTTLPSRACHMIHAEIKYGPYIQREHEQAERLRKYQAIEIPKSLKYTNMQGLSTEIQQKLTKHKPKTIAQASLIPGMTPAALSLLLVKSRRTQKSTTR